MHNVAKERERERKCTISLKRGSECNAHVPNTADPLFEKLVNQVNLKVVRSPVLTVQHITVVSESTSVRFSARDTHYKFEGGAILIWQPFEVLTC